MTGSLLLPILYVISPAFDCQSGQTVSDDLQNPLPNTLGPLSVTWFGSEHNGPSLKVAFDQLSVSKGSAGLFRTALFQTLQLTNLRLCTQADPIDAPAQAPEPADRSVDPMRLSPHLFSRMLQRQRRHNAVTVNWSVPDLGRAANMNIHGFTWVIRDQDLDLTITSRLALLDHKTPDELTLRGHVILQSPDRVIESNHVIYDMQAGRFRIPGSCMLIIGSEKTFQRSISADMQLQFDPPLAVQPTGENLCLLNSSH